MKGKRGSKWYSILYTHVAVKGEVYVMPSFFIGCEALFLSGAPSPSAQENRRSYDLLPQEYNVDNKKEFIEVVNQLSLSK